METDMKTMNFLEKKRQRQIRALKRLAAMTAGKPNRPSRSNADEIAFLKAAIATDKRGVRTKKNRADRGRMFRAA